MFQLASYAALALTAVSSVSGLVVPRASPPSDWATQYLEPYTEYHVRYLAINCQNQHGKPFFNECCHPLLATEKLETARPAHCIPSLAASSSASAVEPTSTVTTPVTPHGDDDDDDGDDDCDDGDDDGDDEDAPNSAPAPAPPAPTPAPAPAPTTTKAPEPATTSHSTHAETPSTTPKPAPAPAPTTKDTPAPAPTPKPASSSGVNTGGFATFFYQNGVAGACGTVHSDNDLIAAIDSERYGNLGAKSGLCGKQVQITNPANKKSVTVTIADACPTCNNGNSIDLSEAAFKRIATLDQGLVDITWSFV